MKRPGRKAFVMIMALTAMVVVIGAMSTIGLFTQLDFRRTQSAEIDAQLRQLLYSSVPIARQMSIDPTAAKLSMTIPPTGFAVAPSATLSRVNQGIEVVAQLGKRTLSQSLVFDSNGKLISATLN